MILAGMEAPPNYGPEYAQAFRRAFPRRRARGARAADSVPARQGRRAADAQPGRRHPSERSRARRIVADTVWPVLRSVLDQMGSALDDRAARRLARPCRAARRPLTILHPLDLVDSERPRRRDHRAVRQRQVDAARPDRRARRADHRDDRRSTASTSPRSARTPWRACAARASASSSSSSTCCRR